MTLLTAARNGHGPEDPLLRRLDAAALNGHAETQAGGGALPADTRRGGCTVQRIRTVRNDTTGLTLCSSPISLTLNTLSIFIAFGPNNTTNILIDNTTAPILSQLFLVWLIIPIEYMFVDTICIVCRLSKSIYELDYFRKAMPS